MQTTVMTNELSSQATSTQQTINEVLAASFKRVMSSYCEEVSLSDFVGTKASQSVKSISSQITFSGSNFNGTFSISLLCDDVKALYANMIRIADAEVSEEEAEDFSKELCNQVFGRFRTEMKAIGIHPNMAIPTSSGISAEEIKSHDAKDLKEFRFRVKSSSRQNQNVESIIGFQVIGA